MALVTIRILEGLERGRVYSNLTTPVTIGREDENTIQLNDERVSRFHAKFQDDAGRVILTDLESTNGTRVNGHPVQIHVLRPGDLVSIGRCLLLFGEAPHREELPEGELEAPTMVSRGERRTTTDDEHDFLESPPGFPAENAPFFPQGVPALPGDLKPFQRALLSDYLAYVHDQLTQVCLAATEEGAESEPRTVRCDWDDWRKLVELNAELAASLRNLANPE